MGNVALGLWTIYPRLLRKWTLEVRHFPPRIHLDLIGVGNHLLMPDHVNLRPWMEPHVAAVCVWLANFPPWPQHVSRWHGRWPASAPSPTGVPVHTWVRVWVIAASSFGGIIDVAVLRAASAVWVRIERFLWLRCGDDGCVSFTTTQAALGIALHTS